MAYRDKKHRAEAQARRRARWVAAGLCQTCGKGPGPGCPTCLGKQRARSRSRAAERKAAGVCYRCSTPLTAECGTGIVYIQCRQCFFKNMAKLHLGAVKAWEELESLYDAQNGRCRFTGELLILGSNTSLDHRVPKARGGTSEIGNLQWTTKQVNLCKRDLTDEEFIALCEKVAGCSARRPGNF